MVIVIAIILLFTGLGVAAYNRSSEQKLVDSEAKKIVNYLVTARSKAMNRDFDSEALTACDPFEGYRMTINTNEMTRNYVLEIKCNGSETGNSTYTQTASYAMHASMDIEVFQNPLQIEFEPSGESPTCASTCTIQVKSDFVGKCREITVESSGVIDDVECPTN